MITQDELIETVESAANFMRGVKFDLRIPQDVRLAFDEKARELDRMLSKSESQPLNTNNIN